MNERANSENVEILLTQAQTAIEENRLKDAGVHIHCALLLDFTHRPTWELLQQLLNDSRPLRTFQTSFAKKHYPDKLDLIQNQTSTFKGESVPHIPITGNRDQFPCPSCGDPIFSYTIICPWCGHILSETGQTVRSEEDHRFRRLSGLEQDLSSHEWLLEKEKLSGKELGENLSLLGLLFLGALLSFILSLSLDFGVLILTITGAVTILSLVSGTATLLKRRKKKKIKLKLLNKINELQEDILMERLQRIRRD